MENLSIELRNVSKRLGPNQALDKISLSFKASTIHGLIGPDGAGKTTLMRILMGLLHPDEGELAFKSAGKTYSQKEARLSMAYMPQSQSLYGDLSVSEHLDFFRDLYGIAEKDYQTRRQELLQITRMAPFVARPAGHLSGGMYKKLGLMCALLPSPRILLLDEPTTGVDPISRRDFWALLYRLVEESHLLILTSTSYMDEAARCGNVHLIESGKTIASGAPREVLAQEKVKTFEELFVRHAKIP